MLMFGVLDGWIALLDMHPNTLHFFIKCGLVPYPHGGPLVAQSAEHAACNFKMEIASMALPMLSDAIMA